MPRKSAEALLAVPIGRPRLSPPKDMSAPARALWREIVDSLKVDHFQPSDGPLLRAYCEALLLSQRASHELAVSGPALDGKTSPWLALFGKASQTVTSLSARLRLCPQSRISRDKAGNTHAAPGPKLHEPGFVPWRETQLAVSEFEDENP